MTVYTRLQGGVKDVLPNRYLPVQTRGTLRDHIRYRGKYCSTCYLHIRCRQYWEWSLIHCPFVHDRWAVLWSMIRAASIEAFRKQAVW